MVVSVSLGEHFNGHPEEAGGLPHIDAGLHEPGRRRVSQDVRSHLAVKPRVSDGRGESLADRFHWLAVPFDGETLPLPFPSA